MQFISYYIIVFETQLLSLTFFQFYLLPTANPKFLFYINFIILIALIFLCFYLYNPSRKLYLLWCYKANHSFIVIDHCWEWLHRIEGCRHGLCLVYHKYESNKENKVIVTQDRAAVWSRSHHSTRSSIDFRYFLKVGIIIQVLNQWHFVLLGPRVFV